MISKSTVKCNYPDCGKDPIKSFGLVPLCEYHFKTIWEETIYFYRNRRNGVTYLDRHQYHKIAHLIPWSKVMREMRTTEKSKGKSYDS